MDKSGITEKDYINFIQFPCLEDITILSIVTELWKQDDIKKEIREHFKNNKREGSYFKIESCYERTKSKILEKLASLSLPEQLQLRISNWIDPIGLQVIHHLQEIYTNTISIYHIIWNVEGRIDEAKTLLLNSKISRKNEIQKFLLLSEYCKKDILMNFWKHLSEFRKNRLYKTCLRNEYKYHLLLYWICYARNELDLLMSLIIPYNYRDVYDTNYSVAENMLRLAISEGYVYAAKYFWRNLNQDEKCRIILNGDSIIGNILLERKRKAFQYQGTNNYSDMVVFLLSKMKGEQQKMVFGTHSRMIIKIFFYDWPWQVYLFPVLGLIWNILSGSDYVELLVTVSSEIKTVEHPKVFPIHKIFKKLLYFAPGSIKTFYIRHLIQNLSETSVLGNLIEIGDIESPSEILRCANDEERKLIMYASIEEGWVKIVIRFSLSFLDVMLAQSLKLESEVKDYKSKTIERWGDTLCSEWLSNGDYKVAEDFLHWVFTSEREIVHYKKEVLDKFRLIENMIYKDKLASLDGFMSWCFSSNKEINGFKQYIVKDFKQFICYFTDWNAFQYFVKWCFISEHEISKFRSQQSKLHVMLPFISNAIQSYKFEFSQNMLDWCYESKEEVCHFKANFILSQEGFKIFVKFLNNDEANDADCDNWELLKKFYCPLDDEFIVEVKRSLIKGKRLFSKHFRGSEPFYSSKVRIKIICHLLENYGLSASNDDNIVRDDTVSKQTLREIDCYDVFKESINEEDNKISDTRENDPESSFKNSEDFNSSIKDDESDTTSNTSSEDSNSEESADCEMKEFLKEYRYFYNSDIAFILEKLASDSESDYSEREDSDISELLVEYDEDVAIVLIDIIKKIEI